jgi:hypothetical protein
MAATVTKRETRRRGTGTAGGTTVRAAIDAFLDTPKIKGNPNTLRACTNVLDRIADQLDADRALAGVDDAEIGDALTELWGQAKPATWNRNRAAVGSWLTWCTDKHTGPAPRCRLRRSGSGRTATTLRPSPARGSTGSAGAGTCRCARRRCGGCSTNPPLVQRGARAEHRGFDLPNKQARITAKGGDIMWITWGTDTAHLLPRLIAGRERGPLLLSEFRPGPHRRVTTKARDICPETQRVRLGYGLGDQRNSQYR